MNALARKLRLRAWRANWRDSLILVRQFALPLTFFVLAMAVGSVVYYYLAQHASEPITDLPEALYLVLSLTFLQAPGEFPTAWYLELFYFVMPVIGMVILAQGVADFSVAFFNRRMRSKEWEAAVASTFDNHVILVGLGHLGFRIVYNLSELGQDLVVIDANPAGDLASVVRAMKIPLIQEDAAHTDALESAGVRSARSILLCTQNDSLNLQIALKARTLNPNIQVVVRIFDDDFAQALHDQFGFIAMSATAMAAPAFAAAGAGVEMTRPITVDGKPLSLARLVVLEHSNLAGMHVAGVERDYQVSVVLLQRNEDRDLHPDAARSLQPGDTLAVLGEPREISVLVQENNSG